MCRLSDRAEAALGFLLALLIGTAVGMTVFFWWSCTLC